MVCALTHHSFFFSRSLCAAPIMADAAAADATAADAAAAFVDEDFGRAVDLYGQVRERRVERERRRARSAAPIPLPPPRFFFFLSNLLLPHQQHTKALSAAPADPELLAARAQAHLKLGHWLEAADDARRACDLEPGLAKAWARRGCVFFFF